MWIFIISLFFFCLFVSTFKFIDNNFYYYCEKNWNLFFSSLDFFRHEWMNEWWRSFFIYFLLVIGIFLSLSRGKKIHTKIFFSSPSLCWCWLVSKFQCHCQVKFIYLQKFFLSLSSSFLKKKLRKKIDKRIKSNVIFLSPKKKFFFADTEGDELLIP